MTERLTAMLHQQAEQLEVPAPPATEMLARGRGIRRRRRLVELGAVVATLVVIGGAFLAVGMPEDDRSLAPAGAPEDWAVASGSTVQLGNGATAEVDGTVKSIYYTGAGALVRTGQEATTDAPDSRYSLVAEDGTVSDVGPDLGDRVPSTDPDLPYLAYAEPTDDPRRWTVVLRDVRTGRVTHEVSVRGAFTWGGWAAPPVSLSGDHVYVALDDATLDVDWRAGTATPSTVLRASFFPEAAGGRTLATSVHAGGPGRDSAITVRDAQSGRELLRVPPSPGHQVASLSPNGEHVLVRDFGAPRGEPSTEVLRIDSGAGVAVDAADLRELGWTPDGWLLAVRADSVEVCDPDTGRCETTGVDIDGENLRVGGVIYES